jgi:Na+/H+ antiporter NhaC
LNPPPHAPLRWINALAPIALVILLVMVGLYYMGTRALAADGAAPEEFTLRNIIGSANSYPVLLVASLAGSILAAVLAWWQGILTAGQCAAAWLRGGRAMLLAVAILVLAWGLSAACDGENLNTAWYVVEQTEGYIAARWMPVAAFVLSAAIAFATGTSWGTMGILTPLMIFVTHRLLAADAAAVDPNDPILLATIGAVLAGSIFGDHCSPISDTTVLSSMASGCDHLDHVATQMPYALLVAAVAILFGYLPAGLLAGRPLANPYLLLTAATLILILLLALLGRSPTPAIDEDGPPGI